MTILTRTGFWLLCTRLSSASGLVQQIIQGPGWNTVGRLMPGHVTQGSAHIRTPRWRRRRALRCLSVFRVFIRQSLSFRPSYNLQELGEGVNGGMGPAELADVCRERPLLWPEFLPRHLGFDE
jgi:hypothetical protein